MTMNDNLMTCASPSEAYAKDGSTNGDKNNLKMRQFENLKMSRNMNKIVFPALENPF